MLKLRIERRDLVQEEALYLESILRSKSAGVGFKYIAVAAALISDMRILISFNAVSVRI